MKTQYELLGKSNPNDSYKTLSVHDDLDRARASAGHPNPKDWKEYSDGDFGLNDEHALNREALALAGIGYKGPGSAYPISPFIISVKKIAETDAERIEMAVDMAWNGSYDGAHHKDWVIDQILRILLGDRYEAAVAEYCDGEDGPDTYSWDEGIAP